MTHSRQPGAFTLAELLAAIAIVAVMAALTLFAVARVTGSARLASGTNTVTAALDHARALALRRNRAVLVVFRPVLDGKGDHLETVTSIWSGETNVETLDGARAVSDRFVPVPDIARRRLPTHVLVAGPAYRLPTRDETWLTPTTLSRVVATPAEAPGALVGVMFGPDGTPRTSNPHHDSTVTWVDFDGDGQQRLDGDGDDADPWAIDHALDETFVNLVPFLAVFDDVEARSISGDDDWRGPTGESTRRRELTAYIEARAERLHFNAFTGVAMR